MKFLPTSTLLTSLFLPFIAAAPYPDRTHATVSRNSIRDIENLNFYTFWFLPGAPITLFQSSLVAPAGSAKPHTPKDVQAIWPGLEPEDGGAVLQNVVTNLGKNPGQWFFLPFYCCKPVKQLRNATEVYTGDAITNMFALDTVENHWANVWFDSPGTNGTKSGLGPFSGALSFDLKKYPKQQAYTTAVLAIELQGKSTWDFGPVTWQNIIIQAATTETEWCTQPVFSNTLNATYTEPVVAKSGGSTVCRIEKIIFNNYIH